MSKFDIRGFLRRNFSFIKGNYLVMLIVKSYPRAAYFLYYPFREKYFLLLGGSTITLGWMAGVRNLINSLVQIPSGYLADYLGRRRILVVGHFLTGLAWFFRGLAPDWKWFFAVQIFMASVYFYRVADNAVIMDSLPPESRGMGLATLDMAIGLAGLFSPIIGGMLFDNYGVWALRVFLLLSGTCDVLQGLLFYRYLKETLVRKDPVKPEPPNFVKLMNDSLKSVFETIRWMPRSLLGMVALNVVTTIGWALTGPFFSIYALVTVGLLGREWGLVNLIERIVSLTLRLPGGKIVDTFSRRKLLIANLAVNVIFLIALTQSRTFIPILILFLVSGISTTLTGPATRKIQADLTPRERRGRAGAVFHLFGSFSTFLGSILGGYLYDLDPTYPFWVSAFLSLIGVTIVLLTVFEPETPEQ